MARKLVVPPRKPTRTQPRPAPYALPHRGPLVAPAEPQLQPRYLDQEVLQRLHYDLAETSYSSSDGPPTPESTPFSPTTSPPATHASPANQYPVTYSEHTSCTDNISGFVFVDHGQEPLNIFGYQPPPFASWSDQSQPLNILTPPESTTSSLAGIQTSPETDSFVHHVEFPNGPSPTRLQSFPQTQGPWTPYPFRQDDPMILDSDSSPSPWASPLSPASSNGRPRRLGPLSHDQRRNANRVRDVGACIRCSCMKEKCNDDPECKNCRTKKTRKWKLGCVRQKLPERVGLLFPKPIEDRYDRNNTNQYVNGGAFWYVHERPHFMLKLHMGLGGPPLEVPVREIEPIEHKRILQSFQVNSASGNLETKNSYDPPIVPYLLDKHGCLTDLFTQLADSMRSVFKRKQDDGSYYWPWDCFEGMSSYWVGEVVEKIHEFHHKAPEPTLHYFQPIRTAHMVLYFNYMLDHPILVTDGEEQRKLFANLVHGPDREQATAKWISPETVQRFIKATIFPDLKKKTTDLLTKLHETLLAMATAKAKDHPAGPSLAQRDLVFSLSFMLLVIIGQTQARLLLLSELSKSERCIDLSLDEAARHIDEVEKSLAEYIILFHEFAVKKRPRANAPPTPISPIDSLVKPEEAYSVEFGLLRQVEDLTRRYHADRPRTFERGELDIGEFDKGNIHRLCWRFVETIFSGGD